MAVMESYHIVVLLAVAQPMRAFGGHGLGRACYGAVVVAVLLANKSFGNSRSRFFSDVKP